MVALLVFGGLGTAWAVANPLGQVPDEPAHVIKAYGVAHGQPFGTIEAGDEGRKAYVFDIPEIYADYDELVCNWGQTERQARTCSIHLEESADTLVKKASPAGSYNPVYYFLVGWPSLLLPGLKGIVAMRIASVWLSAIFLALSVWLLSFLPWRRLPVVAATFAVTPGILFYSASVNPQGAEVATLAAFTAGLCVALRTAARGRMLWWFMAAVAVAGVLGAQMRNLAWIWLGIIVIAAFIYAAPSRLWRFLKRPPVLGAVITVLLGICVNLAILLHLNALEGADGPWGVGWSKINGFVGMLWRGPEFFASMFGTFGWVDTDSHWSNYIYAGFSIAIVVAVYVVTPMARRKKIAVTVALGALWIAPSLIQAMSISQSGFIWQGRYSLPLWMLLIYLAALSLAQTFEQASRLVQRRLVTVAAGSLFIAQLAAFTSMMQREYLGVRTPLVALFTGWRFPDKYGQAPLLGSAGWMVIALVFCALWGGFIYLAGRPDSGARVRQLHSLSERVR